MSYKRVETEIEREIFEQMWESACQEKGFIFEHCADFTELYFIQNEDKETVGTIEFVPYNPEDFTTVEEHFPFSENKNIQEHMLRTYEIDKLSILRDERGKNYIENFMYLFYEHTKQHNVRYYIALIESRFFRALKRIYGVNIEQLGEEIERSNSKLVPIMLNVEYIYQNLESFPWYAKLFKEKVELGQI